MLLPIIFVPATLTIGFAKEQTIAPNKFKVNNSNIAQCIYIRREMNAGCAYFNPSSSPVKR